MDYPSIGPPSGRGLTLVEVRGMAGLSSNQLGPRTSVYWVPPRNGRGDELRGVVAARATVDTP